MAAMRTQDSWGYPDAPGKRSGRTAHKIPLVSPSMDVDVTDYSLKNVGTHLIDHPRDDGQRQREQLWTFQQKYRGAAILKIQNSASCSDGDDKKSNDSVIDEQTDTDVRNSPVKQSVIENSSLPSRFKKRLNQRNLSVCGFRTGEMCNDSARTTNSSKEHKQDEKQKEQIQIQRLYSSGFVVKNSLYNQLRNGDDQSQDNTRLVESFQKYGPGLERLPDIKYPGPKSASYSKQPKYNKYIGTYSSSKPVGRFISQKTFSLRRSLTNTSDLGPAKIKLRLVERRKDESSSNNETSADSGDNNEADDIGDLQADDDDECDNDNGDDKLHDRDCGNKHPEHVDIRHNITEINIQDDSTVPYYNDPDDSVVETFTCMRSEQTFHAEPGVNVKPERNKFKRTDLGKDISVELFNKQDDSNHGKQKVKESWVSTKHTDSKANISKDKQSDVKQSNCKNESDGKDNGSDTDDSLDIPEDRYGPTTHSVDRKLAIRKPWEWKPSPFRWIDRPSVKESDKPYIERIINSGDIIDQFDYDSFARTKPLKLQDFPGGAGYKDRSGVLR